MREPVCLSVCVFVRNRILNHGSNQKMFITKVVRLDIKVKMVKKNFRKNRKKSDQNGIKWNKLELQLQSKNVYNKSCQAYHKSKFGQKIFWKNRKKSDQKGIKWKKLKLQLQSKNVYNKSC